MAYNQSLHSWRILNILQCLFLTCAFCQPVHAQKLETLYSEGAELANAGRYTEALPIFEKTYLLAQKEFNKQKLNVTDYTHVIDKLAVSYQKLGLYEKAEPLFLAVKDLRGKYLGKETGLYATALNNLGVFYKEIEQLSKAESLYLESKAIRERLFGKFSASYATSLGNLSSLYQALGNYPKAEAYGLEAIEVWQKISDGERNYATANHNLGMLYFSMGNYNKAQHYLIEAKEIRKRVLGSTHQMYGYTLNSLGLLYTRTRNYKEAEESLLEAKIIIGIAVGQDHTLYGEVLNNLGHLYSESHEYSKAEPILQASLSVYEEKAQTDNRMYSTALSNLAFVYSANGNFEKAELLLLKTLAIRERLLGKEHPLYAYTLSNLAYIYIKTGQLDFAEPYLLASVTALRQQITRYFPSFSEKEKLAYYNANKFHFEGFEWFCLERFPQKPAILGELFNLRLLSKGLLFHASNKIRQRILTSNDESLILKFNEWQSKKEYLAKVYQMSTQEKQQTGVNVQALENEINALEKELSLKSELFPALQDTTQYTWQAIRNTLLPGEAAIEIIRTQKKVNNVNTRVYAALIVTPKTTDYPDIVILENGKELEGKYSKYYHNSIKLKAQDQLSYTQYWKPIVDKIGGIKKIFLSVDGVYNQINVNTLYNPTTKKYVIDETDVQFITSPKELLTRSEKPIDEIRDATLFGFPNYKNTQTNKPDSSRSLSNLVIETDAIKSDSTQRFFTGESISELPGTKVEVENIKTLLRKQNITLHEYLFDDATESEIKKLNNPQVLHIATHGFFLSDLPKSDDTERSFWGLERKTIVENPLLRSGLLFAGVQESFKQRKSQGEDGILTAYEAMNLDLDRTDLVVLSACETGLGVTATGEGVYGLQRAFHAAGAKHVIMSLWKVSDDATQKLMTQFYSNWMSGQTITNAFLSAQISLREKYRDPYYWGAFILVGN